MTRHLNNEGQEHTTGHPKGEGTGGRGRENEENKVGEYVCCNSYTCMNMEHSTLLKPPKEGQLGRKESNGGDDLFRV
jgi:hypothetical protein